MTTEDFIKLVNADPEGVKTSEDGSYKFIPISLIDSRLDEIFGGQWSWDLQKEFWGKGYVTGKGVLSYKHPATGEWITKSGTAAVPLTKQITLDYPKLESQVRLNAAKKIGKSFGRDLNRDKDDAPLPVIEVDRGDADIDGELESATDKIILAETKEEAEAILLNSGFKFNAVLQKIVNSKPPKNG